MCFTLNLTRAEAVCVTRIRSVCVLVNATSASDSPFYSPFFDTHTFPQLRCLHILGIADHFRDRVIDVRRTQFLTKIDLFAYTLAMRIAEKSQTQLQPHQCMLVDDSVNNLRVASKYGWRTVLCTGIGHGTVSAGPKEGVEEDGWRPDFVVESVAQLPLACPFLFAPDAKL